MPTVKAVTLTVAETCCVTSRAAPVPTDISLGDKHHFIHFYLHYIKSNQTSNLTQILNLYLINRIIDIFTVNNTYK